LGRAFGAVITAMGIMNDLLIDAMGEIEHELAKRSALASTKAAIQCTGEIGR
jgi:hypothetical protein